MGATVSTTCQLPGVPGKLHRIIVKKREKNELVFPSFTMQFELVFGEITKINQSPFLQHEMTNSYFMFYDFKHKMTTEIIISVMNCFLHSCESHDIKTLNNQSLATIGLSGLVVDY